MSYKFVYLAGPIMGCNKAEANDWRKYVADKISPHGIIGISPLRCEPLVGEKYNIDYLDDPKFGTPRAIAGKNYFDVRNCDITLAYLPKPEDGRYPSLGTVGEIFWTNGVNKQTILVSDDPIIMRHPVIDSVVSWKLSTLDEACDVLIGILGAYTGGKNI